MSLNWKHVSFVPAVIVWHKSQWWDWWNQLHLASSVSPLWWIQLMAQMMNGAKWHWYIWGRYIFLGGIGAYVIFNVISVIGSWSIGEVVLRGPFYQQGITLIPVWISNYIHYKVWDEITYRWSLGMDEKIHPTLYWPCNYLSMLGLKSNHVSKMGPRWMSMDHRGGKSTLVHPWSERMSIQFYNASWCH